MGPAGVTALVGRALVEEMKGMAATA